jgi:hypothetical protein
MEDSEDTKIKANLLVKEIEYYSNMSAAFRQSIEQFKITSAKTITLSPWWEKIKELLEHKNDG